MSTMQQTATADRTCARCEMTTRWVANGKSAKTPPNWVEDGGLAYCLACRRELAVESVLADAPDDSTNKRLAELRSAALVEFEVERNPDRRDGEIARAIHCSAVAVGKARERVRARQSA
jgi:hypothetical protein